MAFPYGQTFKDALSKLKREGRYRVFADIVRHRGAFPTASHHTQNAVKPITVPVPRTVDRPTAPKANSADQP